MNPFNFLNTTYRKAIVENSGSKANVLSPLLWLIIVFLCGSCVFAKLSQYDILGKIIFWKWAMGDIISLILVFLAGFFGIFYCLAYLYFMINNSDALRSETYSIQKMAIEKGLVGDNNNGLIEPELKITNKIPPMIEGPKSPEKDPEK